MAFSATRYRIFFKALEIGASAVFLILCAKAFCDHFYNDLDGYRTKECGISCAHRWRRANDSENLMALIQISSRL